MKADASVAGERSVAQMLAPRSLALRMQRSLAVALVLAVGGAMLGWYYLHLSDDAKVNAASRRAAALRGAVASEMKLPALEVPRTAAPPPAIDGGAEGETRKVADAPAAQGWAAPRTAGDMSDAAVVPTIVASGTKMSRVAPVLVRPPAAASAASGGPSIAMREAETAAEWPPAAGRAAPAASLGDALQPTVTKPAEAALVPRRRWLLPKGSFLDCTLETAIDSTFAGLTTCILATDVFGADGRVVLLERGTKLVGETRSEARAGQARVAILWNEARTPTGVVVDLASPGTDELGRAGVPGTVDRHTGERFGAAALLSVLDAAVASFAARRQGAGAIVYSTQGSRDVATEALRNTVGIPPTIRVAPGARVMVTVVRDIDFRSVYWLATHEYR